jgi:hypothetical protein
MGSMLETIKKGISALNPVGKPVDKKPVTPPNPSLLGPKGISGFRTVADRVKKRNEDTKDMADKISE